MTEVERRVRRDHGVVRSVIVEEPAAPDRWATRAATRTISRSTARSTAKPSRCCNSTPRLTSGLEHIYEGHTIATLQSSAILRPLIYGSAGNLVTAHYDRDGRRAIVDDGFTRLYMKWGTAGTARYVKHAASWLVNAERFGDAVVSDAIKHAPAAIATSAPTPPAASPATIAPAADPFLATRTIGLVFVGLMTVLIGLRHE